MKNKNLQNVLNKVVLSTLLMAVTFMLPSCFLFNNDDEDDPKPDTPRSEVPTNLAKTWLSGQFSMTEFWQYDGSYSGNAFEAGLAFKFKPNGDCEFYLVAGGGSYGGCRTQLLVNEKGTVVFNQNNHSFTFYPTEGRSRGFYRGCASSYKNYDQKTAKKDLKPETYYYSIQKDSNGQDQLITRF